jgi:hypothetical protein
VVILDRDDAQDAWVNQFTKNVLTYHLSFAGENNHPNVFTNETGKFDTYFILTGLASNQEKDHVQLKICICDSTNLPIDSIIISSRDTIISIRDTIITEKEKIISKRDTIVSITNEMTVKNPSFYFSLKKVVNGVYELNGDVTKKPIKSLRCYASYFTKRELPSYIPDDVKYLLQGRIKQRLLKRTEAGIKGLSRSARILTPMLEGKIDTSEVYGFSIIRKSGSVVGGAI